MDLKKYKRPVQNIIAVICVIYIIFFLTKNRAEIQQALNLRPLIVAALIIILILDLAINGLRMKIVMEKCSDTKIPLGPWYKIFILGRFLNTVIPQLGNLYRGITLKQKHNISYTNYISSLAAFAWMEISINLIIALIIVLLTNRQLQIAGIDAWIFLTGMIIVIMAGPIIADAVIQLFKIQNKALAWIHSKLSQVFSTAVTSLKDIRYMTSIVSTTLLAFIIVTVMFRLCFMGINIHVSITEIVIFLAILKVMDVIVITPGNVGIREIFFGIVTQQIGLSMMEGILASTILRILGTMVVFILGVSLGGIGILQRRYEYSQQSQSQRDLE
ncbi:MAG: flippase-like domain-containing protein [Sedimentisphaerales bacterium]|nr:flippase-like domain-containing protein [Sedimentisphaerales bacterium]